MSGKVTFLATEQDYVLANRLWHGSSSRQRWLLWLGLAAIALACIVVTVSVAVGGGVKSALADTTAIIFFAIIVLGSRILTIALLPRQVNRMFRQNPALGETMQVCWDAEGIYFAGGNGTANLKWTRLHRWLEDGANFIFLQTERLMYVVPKRILSVSETNDLYATASASGLPRR